MLDEYGQQGDPNGCVLVMEGLSPLFVALSAVIPDLIGSEFLGDDHLSGEEYEQAGDRRVRHESLTDLSFSNNSLRLITHSDVMEHVPDYKAALRECFRALVPGGSLVFTCPFFASRTEPLVRARFRDDGQIEYLEPPEIHGDPLSKEGILAWYHHGWGLLNDLRDAGFDSVQLGCIYDAFSGFVSTGFSFGDYGVMLPIVIRARKRYCE